MQLILTIASKRFNYHAIYLTNSIVSINNNNLNQNKIKYHV